MIPYFTCLAESECAIWHVWYESILYNVPFVVINILLGSYCWWNRRNGYICTENQKGNCQKEKESGGNFKCFLYVITLLEPMKITLNKFVLEIWFKIFSSLWPWPACGDILEHIITYMRITSIEQSCFRQSHRVVTLMCTFWIGLWKGFAALQYCEC